MTEIRRLLRQGRRSALLNFDHEDQPGGNLTDRQLEEFYEELFERDQKAIRCPAAQPGRRTSGELVGSEYKAGDEADDEQGTNASRGSDELAKFYTELIGEGPWSCVKG